MPEWLCPNCGFRSELKRYYWRCPKCTGPLEISYESIWRPRGRGLLRYRSALPVKPIRTLGEGSTPLIRMRIRGIRIFFKLEYMNPTGSFKDRGAALSIALARSLGYNYVVEDTSGNTGISVSAYARLYGLKPLIFMPSAAPEGKKNLIKMLGGNVIECPSRDDAAKEAVNRVEKDPKAYYVAHAWSPLFIEANKTIAYECFEQGFRKGIIFVPIGSGNLLLGIYKGFRDLVEWGLIEEIPLIVGVQGCSVHPVYDAIYSRPVSCRSSKLADGIMVPNPPRINEIVNVIKRFGKIMLVDDNEIIKALKILVSKGLLIEPTSAAPFAAVMKALDEGIIDKNDLVLIPLTGSGLKVHELWSIIWTRTKSSLFG